MRDKADLMEPSPTLLSKNTRKLLLFLMLLAALFSTLVLLDSKSNGVQQRRGPRARLATRQTTNDVSEEESLWQSAKENQNLSTTAVAMQQTEEPPSFSVVMKESTTVESHNESESNLSEVSPVKKVSSNQGQQLVMDSSHCVQENTALQNCASGWWHPRLNGTTYPLKMRDELLRSTAATSKQCVPGIPTLIQKRGMIDSHRFHEKYIFEFYGDSTLRQLWERFIKGVGVDRNAKALASMRFRGPAYAVKNIARSGDPSNLTSSSPCTTPQHRSSFRFDYSTTDFVDPTAEVERNSTALIPDEFLIESLKGKTTEEKLASNLTQHEATNNNHSKVLLFSLGAHPTTYYLATGAFLKERKTSYNTTKFRQAKYQPKKMNLAQFERDFREAYQRPIFQWLSFLASRKNVKMLIFMESFVECNAMADSTVKKSGYLTELAPRCRNINLGIRIVSKVIREIFASVVPVKQLVNDTSTSPQKEDLGENGAELVEKGANQTTLASSETEWVQSGMKLLSKRERKRVKALLPRAVFMSGFDCDYYNPRCKSEKCYCTVEGLHYNKRLSQFIMSNALGLVHKYDQCAGGDCP